MPDNTVAVEPKPWFKSITVWANVVAFLLVALPLVDAYVAGTTLLSESARVEIVRATALIGAIGNIALRLFATKQPIEGVTRARVSPKVGGPG